MLPASYKTFRLYLVCKGEVKRTGDFCRERLSWSDSGPRSLLGSSGLHHRLLCAPQRRGHQWCNPAANQAVFTKPGDFFHSSFFSLKNKRICLLNCVNMRLWSWKKRWRKNNPSYMIIISQQTFQQWLTVIFSQCLVLVKKKKKKKKRIVEWKLCQCWRNTFALCLVSFFDYLAIRKTSKILYFVKKPKSSWKDNNLQR